MREVSVILARLLEIKERQGTLDSESKALWKAFYRIADREAGEEKSYHYLDEETGMTIGRVIALSEVIDPAKLEEALSHKQWLSVTKEIRQLDQARLEVEMDKESISKEDVEPCINRKKTARKNGPRKASKEDLEAIEERRLEEGR